MVASVISLLPQATTITAATVTDEARASSRAAASSTAFMLGYHALPAGGNAFVTTLLASAAAEKSAVFASISADASRDRFDFPALDRTTAVLRLLTFTQVSDPLLASKTDMLFSNLGLEPLGTAAASARASDFTWELNRQLGSLTHQAGVAGNSAAGAAGFLRHAIASAATSDYFVSSAVADLADGNGGTQVNPATIGFGFDLDTGRVTFDGATFAAAYASTPVRAAATFMAMVGAIDDTLKTFDPPVGQK